MTEKKKKKSGVVLLPGAASFYNRARNASGFGQRFLPEVRQEGGMLETLGSCACACASPISSCTLS
jgi:hypothetical protein